ncbi:MAG: DUF2510 domain-containing protein [Actinomycetota bacterium]|nr:DUF2510 domain-containing protein [Actinomycetota bacterium]
MTRTLSELFAASPAALVENIVLALAFSWLGYRISVRHRAVRGVTPWRLPSYAWALICLVFQFIGLALEILAELTTRPALPSGGQQAPSATVPPYRFDVARPGGPTAPGSGTFAEPDLGTFPSNEPAPPPSDAAGRPPLFGWYPDPRRRHERRYFDGRRWSDLVADAGTVSEDPVATPAASSELPAPAWRQGPLDQFPPPSWPPRS